MTLKALARFKDVEYKLAALVVNLLVVIKIKDGIIKPKLSKITVKSLSLTPNIRQKQNTFTP